MAKARRRVRRGVFACEYIRRVVLDLTQQQMADVLGCARRTIWTYENQDDIDVDHFPLHYVRLCRAYAKASKIAWPDSMTATILAGDLFVTETAEKAQAEEGEEG